MTSDRSMHEGNNFDFVRLAAALSVVVSHQFALEGLPEPLVLHYQTLGGFAVLVFFSISGFLICKSWLSDPNIFRFMARRLLRIWPALVCSVLLCGLVLAPIVTQVGIGAYFSSSITKKFFLTAIFWVHPFLPGVFPNSPVAYIPNGVFWTIPIELRCYLYLAALGLLGIMRRKYIVAILLAVAALWYFGIHGAEKVFSETHTHIFEVEYACFFFFGAVLYMFRRLWSTSPRAWLVASVAALMSMLAYDLHHALITAFLATPVFVILFGSASTPVIRRFGRFGDLSYGVYVYAFPVQQTLIWLTPKLGYLLHLLLAVAITLSLAWISWHFIEKRALMLKPRRQSPLAGNVDRQRLGTL